MGFTINGVYCDEIVQGYTEEADLNAGVSSRKGLICNWVDRFTVARGLLGMVNATKVGGAITIYRPAGHPELYNCYCTRVSFEPKGAPSRGRYQMTWPKVIIWAEFGSMPWSFSQLENPNQQLDPKAPLVYAEQRMSSSYELMQLPGSGCTWAATTHPLQEPATKRVALMDMEITLKQLPYMPTLAVFAKAGLINSATFLGIGAGQLLFNGVQTQQVAYADGTYAQEASYSFTARTIRWDYLYDKEQLAFDQVKVKNGTENLVVSADFSDIIPGEYQEDPPTREGTLVRNLDPFA